MTAVVIPPTVPVRNVNQRGTNVKARRQELDTYYRDLLDLASMEPGMAMQKLSAIHARLVGIRADLVRMDDRSAQTLRTQEIDPLINAVMDQFKILSRFVSIREQEWKVAG